MVVTDVQSESFGLVIERHHYNGRDGYRAPSLKRTSHTAMHFHPRVWYHALSMRYACI